MPEYIEREALLKVLPPKCGMGDEYALAYNTCLNCVKNLINEQPTADVSEVKYGKWIFEYTESRMDYEADGYRCSCCNCIEEMQNKKPFCPNCGAKMDDKEKV